MAEIEKRNQERKDLAKALEEKRKQGDSQASQGEGESQEEKDLKDLEKEGTQKGEGLQEGEGLGEGSGDGSDSDVLNALDLSKIKDKDQRDQL